MATMILIENRNSQDEMNQTPDSKTNVLSAVDPNQRSLTMSSQESIQMWIDSLSDGEVPDGHDEEIEAMTMKASAPTDQRSYLAVIDSDDDLILGAEAKTLGSSPSAFSLSPRISPLPPMEREEEHPRSRLLTGPYRDRITSSDLTDDLTSSISLSQTRNSPQLRRNILARYSSTDTEYTHESVIESVYSLRSVLGAPGFGPEEMLVNLGFCGTEDSPLARIPRRFFTNRSAAAGIDIDQFLEDCDDASEGSFVDEQEFKERAILSRFSQSSVDLSSVDSDLVIPRRKRHLTSLPTILIDPSDDTDCPGKNTPPKLGNLPWSKLSTLEEEYEPPYVPRNPWRSPRSSISFDRRPSLQRQTQVDGSEHPQVRKMLSSSLELEDKVFMSRFGSPQSSLDREERRGKLDSNRKSFSAEQSLDVVDEVQREEDAIRAAKYLLHIPVVEHASIVDAAESHIVATQVAQEESQQLVIEETREERKIGQGTGSSSPRSSLNAKETHPVGKIEEKINHLRTLLKLDVPASDTAVKKPDIIGLSEDNREGVNMEHTPVPQEKRVTKVQICGRRTLSKQSTIRDFDRVSLPDIVGHQSLESLDDTLPRTDTLPVKDPGCEYAPPPTEAVEPQGDGKSWLDCSLNTLTYEEITSSLNESIYSTATEGVESSHVQNTDSEPVKANEEVVTENCELGDKDCNKSTVVSADLPPDKSSLDLLEKLNSSRHRLRKSMTLKRRGSLETRRGLSAFISLPNILDLPSASSVLKDVHERENERDRDWTSSWVLSANQNNINNQEELTSFDGPENDRQAMMSTEDFRNSMPGFRTYSLQNLEASERLQRMEKNESKDSDQTFVQEQSSDTVQSQQGDGTGEEIPIHTSNKAVPRALSVPVVVVSFDDSYDSNNNDSTDSQKAFNVTDAHSRNSPPVEALGDREHIIPSELFKDERTISEAIADIDAEICAFENNMILDNKYFGKSDTPISIVDRTKARMLPKGYSIDSSGFEDESELGRISPDKSEKFHSQDTKKGACHLCEGAKGAFTSHLVDAPDVVLRDNKDLDHDNNATRCEYCLHDGSDELADLNVLCLDHDHFDFLAQQLSSLKREMHKQEERIKKYIDEQLLWKSEATTLRQQVINLRGQLRVKTDENTRLKLVLKQSKSGS